MERTTCARLAPGMDDAYAIAGKLGAANQGQVGGAPRVEHALPPGYYMNKRHWITIDLEEATGPALPAGLVEELVEDSYSLIVESLPARLRPAPPAPRGSAS